MISLYDGKISDLINNGARYNPEITALSYAVLEEKRHLLESALQTRTLSMIDELPERILDILAVELRTPFYQEDFTIASKRRLIKETLIYYTYMGTPAAVNRMLSAVYPGSYIEEWYTYGGQPYHFQVILEMSKFGEAASGRAIVKAVQKVKRLTAHLDGLIYQCNIGIVIKTHGRGYHYHTPWTGALEAGTYPWRNMRGGLEDEQLDVAENGTAILYNSDLTGTKPWRNKRGGYDNEVLEADSDSRGFEYNSVIAGTHEVGTVPYQSTKGGASLEILEVGASADAFLYTDDTAGTKPKRATLLRQTQTDIDVQADRKAYQYTVKCAGQTESGTDPARATTFRGDNAEIEVASSSEGFIYTAPATGKEETGTVPQRDTQGGEIDSAFYTTADGHGYPYRIIMCGTAYCSNKRRRSLC